MKQDPSLISGLSRGVTRAFSLIEIMIVLAIMAILVGVVVTNFTGTMENANIDTARIFVKSSAETALLQYKIHMGSYPTTAEGLQALITAPGNSKSSRWRGPYLDMTEVPKDPWGSEYQYKFPKERNAKPGSYDLFSCGPDGQPGNADDVGNWSE